MASDSDHDIISDSDDEKNFMFLAMLAECEKCDASRGRPGGSVPGRRTIHRESHLGYAQLFRDYFADVPTYHEGLFRRRFRMSKRLFLCIVDGVMTEQPYFHQRRNHAMKLGHHPLIKITAALRMLAYGPAADSIDEYLRIAETTTLKSTRKFVKGVIAAFGAEYLRAPTEADTQRLLAVAEQRGFPGMLGSLDCMHWRWKNCPTAWAGSYSGHAGGPTIILEAVASYDGWIWHSFFGTPGSSNDINVLQRSPPFDRVLRGEAPPAHFTVNGREYNHGYYLVDGIYPEWATLVKDVPAPITNKVKLYTSLHHAARKDIERAFGQLQGRFHIIRGPARHWKKKTIQNIMSACVIMHNMIVEDEGGLPASEPDFEAMGELVTPAKPPAQVWADFVAMHSAIRDRATHAQLRNDLVEHLWALHGGR